MQCSISECKVKATIIVKLVLEKIENYVRITTNYLRIRMKSIPQFC